MSVDVVTWSGLPTGARDFVDAVGVNPFERTAWLDAWYAHYLPAGWREHVLLVRRDAAVIGVVPLAIRGGPVVRRLRFAGHGLGNYLEPIAREADGASVVAALRAHLAALRPAVLEWRDLREGSSYYRAAREWSGGRAARLYPCPRAVLGPDWDAQFRAVVPSRKHRRGFERARERLARLGALQFTLSVPSLSADDRDGIRRLHAERFAGTPNILLDPVFWAFFGSLAERALGRDLLVSTMRLDGILVSVVIGLREARRFISYAPAFDPALAIYVPGHVHLMLLQQELIAGGWHELDFSKGEDAYKRRWSNAEIWNEGLVFADGHLAQSIASLLVRATRARAWARSHGLTRLARRALTRRAAKGARAPAPLSVESGVLRWSRVAPRALDWRRSVAEYAFTHPDHELVLESGALVDRTANATAVGTDWT